MLYLTTDGYKDQYNDARQRFMPKRLRPLLTENSHKAAWGAANAIGCCD